MSTSPLSFQNEEENQLLGPSSTSSNDGSSPSSSFTDSSDKRLLSVCSLISMFCFCFANGAMLSGYFLIVLPIESARIDESAKAMFLGGFIAMAGLTQLVCPLIGLISDNCTAALGRRRPFMLIGGSGGITFLMVQLYASNYRMWWLYSFAFTMAMISLNIIYSAMVGLVPDQVHDSQVGAANGIQAVLSVLGAVGGFAFFIFFLKGDPPSLDGVTEADEVAADQAIGGMYVLYIFLIASTICVSVITTTECRLPLPPDASSRRLITNLDWPEVKSSYVLSPTDHHDFFWVTASRTLYYMGISAQTFFLYFLKDVAKMSDPETGVTILSSVAQLAAACSAYPVGMLSDKLGKGRKLFIYVACAILAIGNASFIFCRSLLAVCIISGLIGVGNGGYLAMDSALAIDTLPNKHEAAKFLGIWGVASFLGTALGPMVGGPLLYFVGRTDVEGVYSVQGYAILLCMSVVYFVCAALVLRKVEKG